MDSQCTQQAMGARKNESVMIMLRGRASDTCSGDEKFLTRKRKLVKKDFLCLVLTQDKNKILRVDHTENFLLLEAFQFFYEGNGNFIRNFKFLSVLYF